MKKNLIFYSSVSDLSLFNTQQFYQTDIKLLQELGYNVILSNKVVDAFKFWTYDVVFGYFFRYSFFFILIAKLFGRNSYLTGGIDALDINLVGKKEYMKQRVFFILCFWIAKKCIIVSETDLQHVEAIVGKETDKIVYSEHSIDTLAFLYNINNKQNNFVTIGWMGTISNVKRKGIDKALYLFARLKQQSEYTDSMFFIIGRKGEGTPYLEKLIKEYKLENSVVITGEVTEEKKIDYLKNNKYYFQLSIFEGFGVAALEALIAGCVIIHSGKGGLSNSIYNRHIFVDIDKELDSQINSIIYLLKNVNYEELCRQSRQCGEYYDNKRRFDDFKKIIR